MKKRKLINSKKVRNKVKKDNFPRDNRKSELERTGPNFVDMFVT
jgi:hypothetical protein